MAFVPIHLDLAARAPLAKQTYRAVRGRRGLSNRFGPPL